MRGIIVTWRSNNFSWPKIYLLIWEGMIIVLVDGKMILDLLQICIARSMWVTRVQSTETQINKSFWQAPAEKDHSTTTPLGLQKYQTSVSQRWGRDKVMLETWTRTVNLAPTGISNNSNVWLNFQEVSRMKTDNHTTLTARWSVLAQPWLTRKSRLNLLDLDRGSI